MKIRDFTTGDLGKVVEFRRKSSAISFPDSKPDTEAMKRDILKTYGDDRGSIKIVEENGKVIGDMILKAKSGPAGKFGAVSHIFVDEIHRRRGIGAKLMEAAEHHFRKMGIRKIRATVTITNKESLAFCKSLGYKEKRIILEKEI